jgi:hypothetical protein
VDIPITAYTPTWTGASSNPAIGDGTLQGYYSRNGRQVTVLVNMVAGSTTTFGSGTWFFALPFLPNQNIRQQGAVIILDNGTTFFGGAVQTLIDGTLRMQVYTFNANGLVTSAVPMTWAVNDYLRLSLTYDM